MTDMPDADALFREAQAAFNNRDFETAERLCRQVVEAEGGHGRALHMLGATALEQGRFDDALTSLAAAVSAGNEHPMLAFHKGLALFAKGATDEAVAALRQAADANPGVAEVHFNLGQALAKAGYRDACLEAYARATDLQPGLVPAWLAKARTLMHLRRYGQAREAFEDALRAAPGAVEAIVGLGDCDRAQDRPIEAIDRYRQAHASRPESRPVAERLARMISELSEFPEIERELREIASRHPQSAPIQAALAAFLERRSHASEAEECANAALAIDPGNSHARLTLARLMRRDGRNAQARGHLDALLDADISDPMRIAALKEMASVLDSDGAYAEAFEHVEAANALSREMPPQTTGVHNLDARLENYRTWSPVDEIAGWVDPPVAGDGHRDPVFFVGFPRSGTTLIEAMLDAHPNLVSAGERAWLLMTLHSLGEHDPSSWKSLGPEAIARLREIYWSHAERVHGDNARTRRVVDKMPLNIVDLPFVRRIFPKAKILVAIRDPRDCVLSALMQNFMRTPEMEPFLDLGESARFYADVMSLWMKWRDQLGLDWLEVRYEDLIADPEACFRQVLDFLGEPWDDAVLRHHERGSGPKGIRTPSSRDAAGEVHSRARGRWRHYETQLAPVAETLRPFVEAFGYAENGATAIEP